MTTKTRFPRLGRRSRTIDLTTLARCVEGDSETGLPIVYRAVQTGLDPGPWAKVHREQLREQLSRHGILLFRNFPLNDSSDFQVFAAAIVDELYGNYGDLPKEQDKIYHSTPYPEDRMILYHNESSHLQRFPTRQLFFCMQPSPVGGATPVADGCKVVELLGEDTIRLFRDKGLRYIRNFLPGLDVSWQNFFKTQSRDVVAETCARSGMTLEWLGEGCSVYNQARAVIDHPLLNRPVFFNQIQLHHPLCLEDKVRNAMLELYGMERFPRNVTFGDGTPIDEALIQRINHAYETAAIRFDWQKGDVLMLDNTRYAHARDPFSGPRKILVAMADLRQAI